MRHKLQEPVPSLHRTEALSPTWTLGRKKYVSLLNIILNKKIFKNLKICIILLGENEYPDSPESNETIIDARPYRIFSPTRDVAINTNEQLIQIAGKSTQCNSFSTEERLNPNYKQNHLISNFNYGEIPFQNTVQNVQNQIIQENMQQNYMCNQNMLVNNLNLQQNLQNLNQGLRTQSKNVPIHGNLIQTPDLEHIIQQNQLQSIIPANNHAMPQEPRKILEQTFTNIYKQPCNNFSTQIPVLIDAKQYKTDSLSPDHSSQNLDVSQNLNDAFCLPKNDDKTQNLNENYNKTIQAANLLRMQNSEISVITNNATYNDDSLLEFLIDSPTPSENDIKSKDTAVNTDNIPHAPLRKKKVEKLEQLMLNAINSQNEVVNKVRHYFFLLIYFFY